ncbi:MAG: HEAT repeat domain-containing protein [Oscillospiraceae bacterium]|nr:HEAT repeat domain-containing protein [Oscillospiraceae bacterium]
MRIQPLYDLLQEINRLYVAGSQFAAQDPRITKLIPVLGKLGEKSPVFKKLKQEVEFLTKDPNRSSERLLEIGVLLYSVLYTQGESIPECDLEDLNLIKNKYEIETNAPYSKLKVLIEALTTSNSGRYEVIKDGYKNGLFKDVRTHRYLADAIEDKYSEISSFAIDVVIPSVGPSMIPYLKEKMDVKGKSYDAMRLKLLHYFKDESVDDYVKKTLEEGSSYVLIEAIDILADDPKNEDILLSLASDKKKEVREAALVALCKQKSEKGIERAVDLFLTKQFKSSIEALKHLDSEKYNGVLFNRIKEAYSNCFLEGEDKDKTKALEDFQYMLQALAFKDDDYIFDFFEELLLDNKFQKLSKYNPSAVSNISNSVEEILLKNNDEKSFNLIKRLCGKEKVVNRSNYIVSVYFKMAFSRLSKEEVYDAFNKFYLDGYLPLSCFCVYNLDENDDRSNYGYYNYDFSNLNIAKIDKRWLQLVITGKKSLKKQDTYERAQDIRLATVLFDPNEENHVYLFKKLMQNILHEKAVPIYLKDLVEKLIGFNDLNMPEFVLSLFEVSKTKNYRYYINFISDGEILKYFPKSSKERFLNLYNETKVDEFFQAATIVAQLGKDE